MANDESEGCEIPEWIVTFGDMMSLLLTFFIMLVSLSQIKENKVQALDEVMRKRYGDTSSRLSRSPGTSRPLSTKLSKVGTKGRARRFGVMNGGAKVSAPVGDYRPVRIMRPGNIQAVGTVIFFPEGSEAITEPHERDLQIQAAEFSKQQKIIEVRGHTSKRPIAKGAPYKDHYDLAFARSRRIADFLIQLGIDSNRIRISVAASHELYYSGYEPDKLRLNPRVEVFLRNELPKHP